MNNRLALAQALNDQPKNALYPGRYGSGSRSYTIPTEEQSRRSYEMANALMGWAQENPIEASFTGVGMTGIPVVSDVAGLAGDVAHYVNKPEDLTWGNAAMSGLGLLPFVPSMAGATKLITSRRGDTIIIHNINTPPNERGRGQAESALSKLLNKADEENLKVALSPAGDFGSNKKRLIRWYKRHGFKENTGNKADYSISESMVRTPRNN